MEAIRTINAPLGRAIRAELDRTGNTAADLARQTSMARNSLTRRLSGEIPLTVAQLVAITDALGITPCSVIHAALKDTPCKS